MADTLVNGSANPNTENPGHFQSGPYWISTTTGAIIFSDSNSDLVAVRTTDGGASWSAVIAAEAGTVASFAAFFDRQNPGNTGTKVYAVWSDSVASRVKYAEFDINAGTWSTPVEVAVATAVVGGNLSFIAVSRSGNRVVGHVRNANNSSCYRSTDGSSWSAASNAFESNAYDPPQGVSVNTGDGDDVGILFADSSATALSVKMYDWSADTWTETAIGTCPSLFAVMQFGSCTRESDGHVIVAVWNATDSATADLDVYDCTLDSISTPTITAKTDALVDQAESVAAGVFVDPNTDDIYVAYATGSAYQSTVNVFYKKSTDGGSTWGSATAYGEDTDDDIRGVHGGVCGPSGGRFQPCYFNEDLDDLFVNLTNDIEIAAAGGGDPEGSLIRGKLIRGGLLRGGVLVG